MAFICYAIAAGMLELAYEEPDLFVLILFLVAAKWTFWRSR